MHETHNEIRSRGSSILSGIIALALLGGATFAIVPTITLQSQFAAIDSASTLPPDIKASDTPDLEEDEQVTDTLKSGSARCPTTGGSFIERPVYYACTQKGSGVDIKKIEQSCSPGFTYTVTVSSKGDYEVIPEPISGGPSLQGCTEPTPPTCTVGTAKKSTSNADCKVVVKGTPAPAGATLSSAETTKKAEDLATQLRKLEGRDPRSTALKELNLDQATQDQALSLLSREDSLERMAADSLSSSNEKIAELEKLASECQGTCDGIQHDLETQRQRSSNIQENFTRQLEEIRNQQVSLLANAFPKDTESSSLGDPVEGYTPPTSASTFGLNEFGDDSGSAPNQSPPSFWSFSNLTSATKSVTEGLRSAAQYVRDTVVPTISDAYSSAIKQAGTFTNNVGTNWGQFYGQGSLPQINPVESAIIGPDFSIAGDRAIGNLAPSNQLIPISQTLPSSQGRLIDVAKTQSAIDAMSDSDPYKASAQRVLDEYSENLESLGGIGATAEQVDTITSSYENLLKARNVTAAITESAQGPQSESIASALGINKAEVESFGFFSDPLRYISQDGDGVLDSSIGENAFGIRKVSDDGWIQVTTQGTRTEVYAPSIAEALKSGETIEFENGEVTFRDATYKVDSSVDSVTYRDVAFSLTNPGVRTTPTEAQFVDARNALTSQLGPLAAENTSLTEAANTGGVRQASFAPSASIFDSVRDSVANWLDPGPSDIAGIFGLVNEGQIESITSNANGTYSVSYTAGNIVRSAVITEADFVRSSVNLNKYLEDPSPQIDIEYALAGMPQTERDRLLGGNQIARTDNTVSTFRTGYVPSIITSDTDQVPLSPSILTNLERSAAEPRIFQPLPFSPLTSRDQAGFSGPLFTGEGGSLTGTAIRPPTPLSIFPSRLEVPGSLPAAPTPTTDFGPGIGSPVASSGWDWDAVRNSFNEYRANLPAPTVPRPVTPTFPTYFGEQPQAQPTLTGENLTGSLEGSPGATFRSAQDISPFLALQALPGDASLQDKIAILGNRAERAEIVKMYFADELPDYEWSASDNAKLVQLAEQYQGPSFAEPSYTPSTTVAGDVQESIKNAVINYPTGDSILEFCKTAFGSSASCSSKGADRLRLVEAVGYTNYEASGSDNIEILRRLRLQFKK